ncbi:MAG: hypothetical protein IKO47_00990 [Ruminococcus sp.]|nr:hypothetical protein [Ruminococcus sp.]
MRKLIVLSTILTAMFALYACSSTSTSRKTSSDTSPTEISDTTAAEDLTGEDTSDIPDTTAPTAPNGIFTVHATDSITAEDSESVSALCNEICYRWTKLNNGRGNIGFGQYVEYKVLDSYLVYTALNATLPTKADEDDTHFELTSLEPSGNHAVAKGVYKDRNSAYGEYIFLLTLSDGRLLVNDMIMNYEGSTDMIYRPEIVSEPFFDFWEDPSLYRIVAQKTFDQGASAN